MNVNGRNIDGQGSPARRRGQGRRTYRKGTVSNVFSRPEIVREEVREHVRAVAKSIGYRGPDPRGRMLRAGKVNAIGVASAEPMGNISSKIHTLAS